MARELHSFSIVKGPYGTFALMRVVEAGTEKRHAERMAWSKPCGQGIPKVLSSKHLRRFGGGSWGQGPEKRVF